MSTYLKEQNPNIQIVCADPYGAAMWSWFTNGNLETNDGDSIAEGIGQGRVTKNIEGIKVDRAYRIPDQIGLTMFTNSCAKKDCSSAYQAASTLPAPCASPKNPAPVKQSSPSLRLGSEISINTLQS